MMFTYLTFKMENSIGIPVSVSLRNDHGLVHYGVGFGEADKVPKTDQRLNLPNSTNLLKRIEQLGLVRVLPKFEDLGLNEGGDYWKLHMQCISGEVNLSGMRDSHSVIVPMIQDFAEILDDALGVTQFIRPTRLDRIDIEFEYDEWDPEMKDSEEDGRTFMHLESVVLDRQTNSIHYTKRFPARCAHSTLDCKFDEEVRDILDQSEKLFTEPEFFDDIFDRDDHSPRVMFTFLYHDGTVCRVHRQLSIRGLRDQIYEELLDVIYENILNLLFKQSLFDKRMVLPEKLRKELPFFVIYKEEEFELEDDPEASGSEMA